MLFLTTGIAWAADSDGDGYDGSTTDCDDGDSTIHPDAQESIGNGVDEDCDGDDAILRSVIETTFPSTVWSAVGQASLSGGSATVGSIGSAVPGSIERSYSLTVPPLQL